MSASFKDCEVLDEDLRDFASEHLAAGAHAEAVRAGDYAGFEIAFSDGESHWRQWFLRRGRQALFVTYKCTMQARGAEDDAVRQALASLRQAGQDATCPQQDPDGGPGATPKAALRAFNILMWIVVLVYLPLMGWMVWGLLFPEMESNR